MKVISHRGNLTGSDPSLENKPEQIDRCIVQYSMNVKVDVWLTRTGMHLGHNEPQYPINNSWIHMRSHFLWVHCKNIEALCYFQEYPWEEDVNYFWHENDSYTLTSRGYIWAYPGKNTVYPSHAITLLPEVSDISFTNFYGICTDYPLEYK